jgi:hypothetical protein
MAYVGVVVQDSSHGVAFAVELDGDGGLLPGRMAGGRVRLTPAKPLDIRAASASLVGMERWKHAETTTDGQGHATTRIVTSTAEIPGTSIPLLGATSLAGGETREIPFALAVPGLGPASLDADVCRLDWILRVSLDVPGGFDASVEVPVRILQPAALLRAGVVDVAEFALYPKADAMTGSIQGSIELDPVPLCLGSPFRGSLSIESADRLQLQMVRLELRVAARATVASGQREEITAWTSVLGGDSPITLEGQQSWAFEGELPARDLPTVELPHGRTDATFHVVLARSWAPDHHLVRDVAICSTADV